MIRTGKIVEETKAESPRSPHELRTFVQRGLNGAIASLLRSMEDQDPPWIEILEPRDRDLLLVEPKRYQIAEIDGRFRIVAKPRVRLTVNDPAFMTDGVDAAELMLLDVPEGIDLLRVVVNGVPQDWHPDTVYEVRLVSAEAIAVTVQLLDSRVYADPDLVLLRGYPPVPSEAPDA